MMSSAASLWTREDAETATGGRCPVPWRAGGVSIDTRTLAPGDLFVAISGPNHDGHDFVARAFDAGAAAAVVSRVPEGVGADAPLLVVDDTLRALEDLGRFARRRTTARVIAITGSVGKTGTKEALRTALAGQATVFASEGSLNNHWGLPLSLARTPRDAAYAVVEMGMNHPGEITPLSRMARPHVAVVTTVERVHAAHFDSVEAIADAKAEIFASVEPGGAAVLNHDNPHFMRLAASAEAAGIDRIFSFGRHDDAGVRLLVSAPEGVGSRIRVRIGGETIDCQIPMPGTRWVSNGLCILAAAAAAGADIARAAKALAGYTLPKGRGRVHRVVLADGGFDLIDDSYNASPVSMAAAFEVLGLAHPGAGGRRIAVLGDMLELGEDAPTLHAALAEPLKAHGVDLVFTCGPSMAQLFDALPSAVRGGHASDSATLVPLVTTAVRAGDVVTVKGSAGSGMGLVVAALLALSDGGDVPAPRAVNGD